DSRWRLARGATCARGQVRWSRPCSWASRDSTIAPMNRANGKPKFNPRLLPPQIGLGLLLAIGLAILYSRGGQPRPTDELEGRVVRRVEQTPDFTYLELESEGEPLWLFTPRVEVHVGDRVYFTPVREFRDFEPRSLKRKFDRLLSA